MNKILITSAGSLVGQNILDALGDRKERLEIVGTNSDAVAPNIYRCNKIHLVSHASDRPRFIDDLVRLIEHEKPEVIIPGRDDDIEILAEIRDQYFPESNAFLCGSGDFALAMHDKIRSHEFAQKHRLPFAMTVESGRDTSRESATRLVEEYGFPCIAKPTRGSGSIGVRVIINEQQLDRICAQSNYAIQPLFGHTESIEFDTTLGLPFIWEVMENNLYGVQVLISQKGAIISSFGFVSKMVMGRCEQIAIADDHELIEIAHGFARSAIEEGWRGPLNIQFKKDGVHGYQAIEMNGRFSGGTSGRLYLGFDEVRELLNEWFGDEVVPGSPFQGITTSVKRSLTDFAFSQEYALDLERNKIWESQASRETSVSSADEVVANTI
ncbi:MAG: hypothetical protein ABW072_00260 [Sedimenticola sp.]